MSKGAKVWIALWVVYVVWGSTYLAIELAGETMPGFFGAGVRFTIAGLLMLGFIAWRRGPGTLRIGRAELLSAAVVGLLLPGANSILFLTEQSIEVLLVSLRPFFHQYLSASIRLFRVINLRVKSYGFGADFG